VVRCARHEEGAAEEMTKLKLEKTATLPSGYVGVHRADDGKGWEAYVLEDDLVLLGVYPTRRAAATARAKYAKERRRAA
jgi:hypothetical protein